MKFVFMLWCNVWVCEFDVGWVVDDEITCSRCVYMYTLCFHSKLMKYNVVVDEFMIGCCCCCYEILLLMIDVMGNHNHRAWSEFVLFLKGFMKNGSNGDFCWNDVLISSSI